MDGGDDPHRDEYVRPRLGRAQRRKCEPAAGGIAGQRLCGRRGSAGDSHGLFLSRAGRQVLPRHRHRQVFQECAVRPGGQSGSGAADKWRRDGTASVGLCGRREIHVRISGTHDEPRRAFEGGSTEPCGHALSPGESAGHDLCPQLGRKGLYPHPLADVYRMHRGVPRWRECTAVDALRHQ